MFLELCLLEDAVCDPNENLCCPGLACLKESGPTNKHICGSIFKRLQIIDESKLFHNKRSCTNKFYLIKSFPLVYIRKQAGQFFYSDLRLNKHVKQADWCQDAGPDCSLSYTRKHCSLTCKGK